MVNDYDENMLRCSVLSYQLHNYLLKKHSVFSHKVQYLLKMAKPCSGIKPDNIFTHLYCFIELLVHIILNMISV